MGAMFGRTPSEMLNVDVETYLINVAGYQHAHEQYLEDLHALAETMWGG